MPLIATHTNIEHFSPKCKEDTASEIYKLNITSGSTENTPIDSSLDVSSNSDVPFPFNSNSSTLSSESTPSPYFGRKDNPTQKDRSPTCKNICNIEQVSMEHDKTESDNEQDKTITTIANNKPFVFGLANQNKTNSMKGKRFILKSRIANLPPFNNFHPEMHSESMFTNLSVNNESSSSSSNDARTSITIHKNDTQLTLDESGNWVFNPFCGNLKKANKLYKKFKSSFSSEAPHVTIVSNPESLTAKKEKCSSSVENYRKKHSEIQNKDMNKISTDTSLTLGEESLNSSISLLEESKDHKKSLNEILIENHDEYLLREKKYLCNSSYIQDQVHISEDMRCTLIDWMVDVHHKFKLLPETFYLSINFLDRFCSVETITRDRYQLLGTACLWLATKYEEQLPPRMDRFVRVASNAFKREDLLYMENILLLTLDYNLNVTTSFHFLKIYLQLSCADDDTQYLAYYFSEICAVYYTMTKYLPSEIASACVYLSQLFTDVSDPWDTNLQRLSRKQVQNFRKATIELFQLVSMQQRTRYDACKRKYRRSSRHAVSDRVPPRLHMVKKKLCL